MKLCIAICDLQGIHRLTNQNIYMPPTVYSTLEETITGKARKLLSSKSHMQYKLPKYITTEIKLGREY